MAKNKTRLMRVGEKEYNYKVNFKNKNHLKSLIEAGERMAEILMLSNKKKRIIKQIVEEIEF